MAAKKENKMIGYLVISVIPVIGIIWAGVEGSLHNKYVKDAIKAEEAFESHFAEVINAQNYTDSEGNKVEVSDVNIVSIVPTTYTSKLDDDTLPIDPSSENNNSRSIKIGANLVTPIVDEANPEYNLEFEFFVTQEVYTDITANFDNGKIGVFGTLDNTYETYFSYNPKNAPIYKLAQYFDEYYQNVHLFSVNNETIVGISSDLVVDLINQIGTVELEDLSLLNKIADTYAELKTDEEKAGVTNYDVYLAALDRYEVLKVEQAINNIPAPDALDYNTNQQQIVNARTDFEKLSDEQKATVSNLETLQQAEFTIAVLYVKNYVDLAITEYRDSRARNALNGYNDLSVEQKALLDTYNSDDVNYYEKLQELETKYNESNTNKKITLEGKDE